MLRRNALPFLQRIPNYLASNNIEPERKKLLELVDSTAGAYKVGVLSHHQVKKLLPAFAKYKNDHVLSLLDNMFENVVGKPLNNPKLAQQLDEFKVSCTSSFAHTHP